MAIASDNGGLALREVETDRVSLKAMNAPFALL